VVYRVMGEDDKPIREYGKASEYENILEILDSGKVGIDIPIGGSVEELLGKRVYIYGGIMDVRTEKDGDGKEWKIYRLPEGETRARIAIPSGDTRSAIIERVQGSIFFEWFFVFWFFRPSFINFT